MGICLCRQGNETNGLAYRMKSLRIIQNVQPKKQYAFWIDAIDNVFAEKNKVINNDQYDTKAK